MENPIMLIMAPLFFYKNFMYLINISINFYYFPSPHIYKELSIKISLHGKYKIILNQKLFQLNNYVILYY